MKANQESKEREVELLENFSGVYQSILKEIHKVIIGQDEIIEQLLASLFAGGHCLIVGVPGLAKTLLINTLANVLDLKFSRIQFTPDLMPSDITGTEIIEEDHTSGKKAFRFVKGPVFANIILADEINRTPPKTQAALLEAMQEHKVTAGGVAGWICTLMSPSLCWRPKTPSNRKEPIPCRKRSWTASCLTSGSIIPPLKKKWIS
jgi:MoxR-like ATPase